jgi:hypothetical protein
MLKCDGKIEGRHSLHWVIWRSTRNLSLSSQRAELRDQTLKQPRW